MNEEDIKKLKKRFEAVWQKRVNDYDGYYAEVALHVLPIMIKTIKNQENHGRSAWKKIVDNTGKDSLKILAAGMVSGTCSPSRPWFALSAVDPMLKKDIQVKQWLKAVQDACYAEFAKSNIYRSVHHIFTQEGAFGTGAAIIPKDSSSKSAMDLIPMNFGEYAITTDSFNKTDGIYRKFKLTVANMVEQFGLDFVSDTIKSAFENNNLEQEFEVWHAIYKRKDAKGFGAKNMPFASIYFEPSSTSKLLKESGLESFDVVCARWNLSSSDEYGESPASDCFGDMRALQKGHEQIAKGVDYQVSPPLLIPSYLKGQERETLPNGIAYYNPMPGDSSAQVQPMMNVQFNVNDVLGLVAQAQERVKRAFHTDLFLMLDAFDKGQMTATEVAERKNEKMMMLGPVVERQIDELLRPLVEICFHRVLNKYPNLMESAPESVRQAEIEIDFVSILAQAQKSSGSASLERALTMVGNIAQVDGSVLDKFNTDAFLDEYADINNIPATIFVEQQKVDQIRAQRAQQQAQAQQQALALQQAQTQQQQATAIKTVGDTNTGNIIDVADQEVIQ